jgi:hypothetical protein
MATLDEIRAAEAELLPTLESLRARVEQQNQAIVDLIARGNITPAEAEAINQRAAQTNQEIEASQALLRRTLALVNEGAGFFNRSAVGEIGTRIRDTVSSFAALSAQARANRQEMNRLATADQAATKEATDAKAATDQGPGTASAGSEVAESDQGTQSPATAGTQQNADGTVTTAPTTNTPSNAEGFQPPGSTTVQPAASALPGTSSPTASGAVPTVTGTPVAGSQATDAGISPGQSDAALSYIYKAVTVTSVFERGRFTQDLEGVLLIFPNPPRKVAYGKSDDNLAYEYTADDNLAYEGRPGSNTATTPPVLTGPVSRTPNAQNLAQAPESSTGEPAPSSESTDTVAPAETAPATSAAELVAAPPANQPPEFKYPGGYVTQIPPGVTRDPNSGAWIYRDASGEEVMFVANTNEALAARIRAYDTGENVKYVDYDRNVGWVYETFDPNTQIREIVGPAPDPYAQPAGTPAPSQNMAREN